ncbi:MAG: hypothetical protein K9M07_02390 [Simkaniaceae bacterium]|nr:hypothetical protein [Simkaniaceae bacterium]
MKKIYCILVSIFLSTSRIFALEPDGDTSYTSNAAIGSADAATTAISISMIGWGIGLTAAIAAITILIPPDEEATTHSHGS